MAGSISPGQVLTPNPNVYAPAGMGGSVWGANGGDQNPMGGSKPIAATVSDGETASNYLPFSPQAQTESVLSGESNAALSNQTLDSAIPSGGSNIG